MPASPTPPKPPAPLAASLPAIAPAVNPVAQVAPVGFAKVRAKFAHNGEELWDEAIFPILKHTVFVICAVGSVACVEHVLKWWVGENAKLFRFLPYSYLANFGDLLAFVVFFRKMWKEFE